MKNCGQGGEGGERKREHEEKWVRALKDTTSFKILCIAVINAQKVEEDLDTHFNQETKILRKLSGLALL